MKKQARYKKGQRVYLIIARGPYDLTVQQGEVVAARAFGAYHDYMYDINDGAFINYDMEESEVYGTYEEAAQAAIVYCDARIEDLKKERAKWEKKLNKKGE